MQRRAGWHNPLGKNLLEDTKGNQWLQPIVSCWRGALRRFTLTHTTTALSFALPQGYKHTLRIRTRLTTPTADAADDDGDDADNAWTSPRLQASESESSQDRTPVWEPARAQPWRQGVLQDVSKQSKAALLLEALDHSGDVLAWATCALPTTASSSSSRSQPQLRSCPLFRAPVRPQAREGDDGLRRLHGARIDLRVSWHAMDDEAASTSTSESAAQRRPTVVSPRRSKSSPGTAAHENVRGGSGSRSASPEFGVPAGAPHLDGLPNGVWIAAKRRAPLTTTYHGKDGFDLYIDGARFLPYNVTISKVCAAFLSWGFCVGSFL